MIFVTGDIHGSMDIDKLNATMFSQGKKLTKNDYVVILGDFGLLWHQTPTKEQIYWLNWLSEKPWTTLVIDGNHQNFERFDNLPTISMFGSDVGKISDSIFHLKRGKIYNIDNNKIFTFGGADSIDKHGRWPGVSWWAREQPSKEEMDLGLKNLEINNFEVDYILTHTCPSDVARSLIKKHNYQNPHFETYETKIGDPLCKYFDAIQKLANFKTWAFGHWHDEHHMGNGQGYKQYKCYYQAIEQLI